MAVFMGPTYEEPMEVPADRLPEQALSNGAHKIPALEGRWSNGVSFLEFHHQTIKAYHQ